MKKIYATILSIVMSCSAVTFAGCSGVADEDADSLLATSEVKVMSNAMQNVNEYSGSYTICAKQSMEISMMSSMLEAEYTEWTFMYDVNTGNSFYSVKDDSFGEERYYVYTTPMENGGYKQYVNMYAGSEIFGNTEAKAIKEFKDIADLKENGYQVNVFGLTQKYYSQSVNDVLNLFFLIDLESAPEEMTKESMEAFWLEGIKNNTDVLTDMFGMEFEYACNNVTITNENENLVFTFDVEMDSSTAGSFMGMTISELDTDVTFYVLVLDNKIVQIKYEMDLGMVAGGIAVDEHVINTMDFTYSYDESLAPTAEALKQLEDSLTKVEE